VCKLRVPLQRTFQRISALVRWFFSSLQQQALYKAMLGFKQEFPVIRHRYFCFFDMCPPPPLVLPAPPLQSGCFPSLPHPPHTSTPWQSYTRSIVQSLLCVRGNILQGVVSWCFSFCRSFLRCSRPRRAPSSSTILRSIGPMTCSRLLLARLKVPSSKTASRSLMRTSLVNSSNSTFLRPSSGASSTT
jgi:hypothetical protein